MLFGGSDGKASAYNVGDLGSVPGSGGSPGEGNGKPTPVFLPGKSMDRRAQQAAVHRVASVGHGLATKPPYICVCVYI